MAIIFEKENGTESFIDDFYIVIINERTNERTTISSGELKIPISLSLPFRAIRFAFFLLSLFFS